MAVEKWHSAFSHHVLCDTLRKLKWPTAYSKRRRKCIVLIQLRRSPIHFLFVKFASNRPNNMRQSYGTVDNLISHSCDFVASFSSHKFYCIVHRLRPTNGKCQWANGTTGRYMCVCVSVCGLARRRIMAVRVASKESSIVLKLKSVIARDGIPHHIPCGCRQARDCNSDILHMDWSLLEQSADAHMCSMHNGNNE